MMADATMTGASSQIGSLSAGITVYDSSYITPDPPPQTATKSVPIDVGDDKLNFKVDDVVVLLPTSKFYSQAPDGCLGRITSAYYTGAGYLLYRIKWDNGTQNSYGDKDIELAHPIKISQERRQMKVGTKVMGIDSGMVHFNCVGYISKIEDYEHKIWVKWGDGENTHTIKPHLIKINTKCPAPLPFNCNKCANPCKREIIIRNRIEREQKRLAAIQAEKDKKEQYYQKYITKHPIKISAALHLFFVQELTEFQTLGAVHYPFMYLLGKNKKGIITEAHILRGSGGCKDIQYISPYEIKRTQEEIFKKGLLVAGIGRVGRFYNINKEGIIDISNMDNSAILLSINHNMMWAHRYTVDGNYQACVQLKVEVIKSRRGGERRNGNQNKESKETNIRDAGGVGEAPNN